MNDIRLREITLLMTEKVISGYGEDTAQEMSELLVEETAQATGISKEEAFLFFTTVCNRVFKKIQKEETDS